MINENQHKITSGIASNLTLRSMKAVLKQIFGENAYSSLSKDEQKMEYPIIKEENAFYVAQNKCKCTNKKLNLLTKQGQISRCAIWDLEKKWAKYC